MRSRDVKKLIRVSKMLETENADLRDRLNAMQSLSERRIPYNYLEILIRSQRREHMIRYETIGLDLRVLGNDNMPTVCNYKTIPLSAFDLLQENEADFIKGIGELMAKELMAYGEKVTSNGR